MLFVTKVFLSYACAKILKSKNKLDSTLNISLKDLYIDGKTRA